MANLDQLEIIRQGVKAWNEWRKNNYHQQIEIDLSGADLHKADLDGANLQAVDLAGANLSLAKLRKASLSFSNLHQTDLRGADLDKAYLDQTDFSEADLGGASLDGARLSEANLHRTRLTGANLREANLSYANLSEASLRGANLRKANLHGATLDKANLHGVDLVGAKLIEAHLDGANLRSANLDGANLHSADLHKADLSGANLHKVDLSGADLTYTLLIEANIEQAILKDCRIYGLSVWDLKGMPSDQSNLVITKSGTPIITVDDLQVAQFIYLLLNNKNIRNVIDTITSKAVLILGRFTDERKAVLDAISSELRKRNYLPIVFDFTGPENRDITETVSTLAHMAKFVVADITDAKSIPQELMAIVPHLPSVPVQPLLLKSQKEYGMFEHFKHFPWVLETYRYEDADSLISSIEERIIKPVEIWLEAKKQK